MSHGDPKINRNLSTRLALAALLPCSPSALAQASATAAPPTLETVQVTATRTTKPASTVPAAISVVDGDKLAGDTIGVNLSEKLVGVTGLLARERQNYAQDLQISIRGFGARSTFGIRGLRLYLDGMPATMPDGQGQVSNFNLASAGRIEVLRGPFSVLYGNASGGVIQMFTADGADDPGLRLDFAYGSDNTQRETAGIRGANGRLDYNLSLTHFDTDGYREHSSAERNSFNGKLKVDFAGKGMLTLIGNALDSPQALDPLGLTAAQFADDPRQAVAAATQFNTRKSVRHQQLGIVFEHDLGSSQSLRLLGYGGSRAISQFLAIPVGTQANPLHGGGVVDLDSEFSGVDARWTLHANLAARPLELVVGVNSDRQDQHRLGFNNFLGSALGVRGLLRRDQDDRVRNFDQYAQAYWSPTNSVTALIGLRHSTVRFDSKDNYITPSNPDDSGQREFSAISPVVGISLKPNAAWNLYASHGRGFETPTFDELGYRPDGSAGLNFDLQAMKTRSTEIGAKGRLARNTDIELALFRADTDNELAVATNAGGRSTFQNVGRARRQGIEFNLQTRFGEHWRASVAYTLIDATFLDAFLTCSSVPCPTPNSLVPAGSDIPGVPRASLHVAANWQRGDGWYAGIAGQYLDSVSVNNVGNARTHPYAVFDANAGYLFKGRRFSVKAYARIGNILDRRYAGSVIVNETSGRFYEPAPGRSFLLGMDWRW
jgi:iron complex outermembrane receptor protein